MNEKEVREQCVKLAELSGRLLREKTELEQIAHEQSVEILDMKKMVAGAQNKEQLIRSIEAVSIDRLHILTAQIIAGRPAMAAVGPVSAVMDVTDLSDLFTS